MMNRLNITILIILLITAVTSCIDDNKPVDPFDEPTPEEVTIQNCYITKDAAEEFAEENDGKYAKSLTDTTLAGHTLIDLLPGGKHLLNPYTGLETEPRSNASEIGEIMYMPRLCVGVAVGYIICTYDNEGKWLYNLYSYSDDFFDEECSVVCGCYHLQDCLLDFAENNNGRFPLDVDTDEDSLGRTLLYYFNYQFDNPFTGLYTNPINGTASTPGEVGYQPVMENDIPVGYIITGYGASELIKEISDTP